MVRDIYRGDLELGDVRLVAVYPAGTRPADGGQTMLIQFLLVVHIAVTGYWLGAEFVINSTSRYVVYRTDMPFIERDRLWDHVMSADQHVRYALILQAMLGTILGALYGFLPGGEQTAWGAVALGGLWLGFIEIEHHQRKSRVGAKLSAIDRGSRYVLILLLFGLALDLPGASWPVPFWLRLKLALFACVMASGVAIRIAVLRHYRHWAVLRHDERNEEANTGAKRAYVQATVGVVMVWVFIAAIVVISVWKPAL